MYNCSLIFVSVLVKILGCLSLKMFLFLVCVNNRIPLRFILLLFFVVELVRQSIYQKIWTFFSAKGRYWGEARKNRNLKWPLNSIIGKKSASFSFHSWRLETTSKSIEFMFLAYQSIFSTIYIKLDLGYKIIESWFTYAIMYI